MGSIITKIYDDYDAYREMCQTIEIQPEAIDKFHDHQRKVLDNLGFSDITDYFLSIRRSKIRSEKIDTIFDKK